MWSVIFLILTVLGLFLYYDLRKTMKPLDSEIRSLFREIKRDFDISKLDEIHTERGALVGFSYLTRKGVLKVTFFSMSLGGEIIYSEDRFKPVKFINVTLLRNIYHYFLNKNHHKNDERNRINHEKHEEENRVRLKNIRDNILNQ